MIIKCLHIILLSILLPLASFAEAQTYMYRGRSDYSGDILYSWDGRYMYQGRSTYSGDVLYGFDGRYVYQGRSTYSGDILYSFNGLIPLPILLMMMH